MTDKEAKEAIENLSLIDIDDDGEYIPLRRWYNGIGKDIRQSIEMAICALESKIKIPKNPTNGEMITHTFDVKWTYSTTKKVYVSLGGDTTVEFDLGW